MPTFTPTGIAWFELNRWSLQCGIHISFTIVKRSSDTSPVLLFNMEIYELFPLTRTRFYPQVKKHSRVGTTQKDEYIVHIYTNIVIKFNFPESPCFPTMARINTLISTFRNSIPHFRPNQCFGELGLRPARHEKDDSGKVNSPASASFGLVRQSITSHSLTSDTKWPTSV